MINTNIKIALILLSCITCNFAYANIITCTAPPGHPNAKFIQAQATEHFGLAELYCQFEEGTIGPVAKGMPDGPYWQTDHWGSHYTCTAKIDECKFNVFDFSNKKLKK